LQQVFTINLAAWAKVYGDLWQILPKKLFAAGVNIADFTEYFAAHGMAQK
jgi:hypothetical protein